MSPRDRPVLAYDGDCGFCRRWVYRWKDATQGRVEYAPAQQVVSQFPDIPGEEFQKAVQLIETDGRVFSGAEAVFRVLAYAPRGGWGLWAYRKIPGAAAASEGFYRFVAGHRRLFSRFTAWLWGNHLEPPTYLLSRWLFLRALGLVYLAAFASLWVQVPGLVGPNGILPVGMYLQAVSAQFGARRFWLVPTFCWLGAGDFSLHLQCGAGIFLAALLIAGVAQIPALAGLWALYLSLSTAGQIFLGYQWDNLLLEAGFLAIFLAPLQLWPRPSRETDPPSSVLWLFRLLLFRLMFSSGAVKLLSGDPVWRDLSALSFHYQTQPLPTWIAWHAHQLPARFQKTSAIVLFAIELGVPFLVFLPRRPRFCAAALIAALMALIFLTGNYCFFNLLTMALCLLLLDDAFLKRFVPRRLAASFEGAGREEPTAKRRLNGVVAGAILALSCLQLKVTLTSRLPARLAGIYQETESLRTVNSYGLFAVMTTSRPEIIVEGSNDLREWKAYEFKWKPGDVSRRPRFVAPHQPRLDWQMWFAALGDYRHNPWFMNFMARLLEGRREVLALLANNPFPDAPPRYMRALYYQYRFTDRRERKATSAWWSRELKGLYCPMLSLQPK